MTSLNLTSALVALNHANETYKARTEAKGAKPELNTAGIQSDIAHAMRIVQGLTDPQWEAINALDVGDSILNGMRDASNVKKPMRTIQAVMFAVTGNGAYLKGSAKTFMLEFCGLVTAGVKNRDGLRFCATGAGNEHTSDSVKTQKARQILKAFGAIKVSSESTQNSVSFSAGGIAAVLGVAHKEKRTGLPVVNLENKVAQKLDNIVREMTDGKLDLLVAQSKGK